MSRGTRTVRRVLYVGHGITHLFEMALPALLVPIQAELLASDLEMGLAVTAMTLLFGVGCLPSGVLIDRVGPKWPLVGFAFASTTVLVGMASSMSVVAVMVTAGLLGAVLSIYHPAGIVLLAKVSEKAGRAFAMHTISGNLAVTLTPLVVGGLGALFGWRAALLALGVVGVGFALVLTRLPASPPEAHQPKHVQSRPSRRRLVLVLCAAFCTGMVYRALITFLPKLITTTVVGGNSSQELVGGAVTTVTLLVGLVGIQVGGYFVDRGNRAEAVFLVGCVAQMLLLPLHLLLVGPSVAVLAAVVMFFTFAMRPLANLLVVTNAPTERRSFAIAAYFLVSSGAGASVGSALAGWVSSHYGLHTAFAWLSVATLPAALMMLLLLRGMEPRRGKRS